MKVLLDACVPRPLGRYLSGHELTTAGEMGWGKFKNGDLLRGAEGQFDVLVTADKNLKYQQNLPGRCIGILVLPTNDWTVLRNRVEEIAATLNRIQPGQYFEIQ